MVRFCRASVHASKYIRARSTVAICSAVSTRCGAVAPPVGFGLEPGVFRAAACGEVTLMVSIMAASRTARGLRAPGVRGVVLSCIVRLIGPGDSDCSSTSLPSVPLAAAIVSPPSASSRASSTCSTLDSSHAATAAPRSATIAERETVSPTRSCRLWSSSTPRLGLRSNCTPVSLCAAWKSSPSAASMSVSPFTIRSIATCCSSPAACLSARRTLSTASHRTTRHRTRSATSLSNASVWRVPPSRGG
mmetsp:Transcript_91117/g.260200  ORF Transcript_91117/g.260200 Transcript_91117/m.260200 type:complete len:247 (-) Transcript_91117:1850-2590(-)